MLTNEQKIKRAVSRKNNKVARELPLLVPVLGQMGLLTNEAEQEERYKILDKQNKLYSERLEKSKKQAEVRAGQYRALLLGEVSSETISELDSQVDRKKWLKGEYLADFWFQAIRRNIPQLENEARSLIRR
jgi:hypothetical protein